MQVELWASQLTNCAAGEVLFQKLVNRVQIQIIALFFECSTMTFSSVPRGSPCLPQQAQSRRCYASFPMHEQCRFLQRPLSPLIGRRDGILAPSPSSVQPQQLLCQTSRSVSAASNGTG